MIDALVLLNVMQDADGSAKPPASNASQTTPMFKTNALAAQSQVWLRLRSYLP